jgi:hypothetical protein
MKQALQNTVGFVEDYQPKPLYESTSPATRNMLVLDDQMDSENTKGNALCKIFRRGHTTGT